MLFLNSDQTPSNLEIAGERPRIRAKVRLHPSEIQAFETEAQQAAPGILNATPEPTEAQAKAGDYRKGLVEFQGIPIAIENPRGSWRRGTDLDGTPWETRMAHHYGFIERTTGADGEGIDVFIGPELESDLVVIVDQVDPFTEEFDEHKVMLGFASEEEAIRGYHACYEPGWAGYGGHSTCTVEDFLDWMETADLDAPSRPIQKAGFAEPESNGTRWITIHPHGDKDAPGHPVQIRPVSGHDGVFHVVGGADGALNGLRLHDIKSPAHYKEEAKKRAKERRAKKKESLAGLTPQERQDRQQTHEDAHAAVKAAEKKLVEATLKAKGIKPEEAQISTEDKLAQHKHRQNLLSDAMRTAKEAEKRLAMDSQARMEAGIEKVGGDNQPSVEELLTVSDDERGPGYQRAIKERAKENGLTSDALADKIQDLKTKAAEHRVEEGKFSQRHEELGNGDVVQGILKAGQLMGDAQREAHIQAKAIKESQNQAIRKSLAEAEVQNDALVEILKAKAELKAARKAAKQAKAGGVTFEKAYQANIEDLDEQIISSTEDRIRTDRMMDFLTEVEQSNPPTENVDAHNPIEEQNLQGSRHTGAWDALHEIGLGILGQGFLERETVEVLGPEGAAIIAARTLKTALTPEDQREILQALEEVHKEEQDTDLPQVMADANQLREGAKKAQTGLQEDAHDLAMAHQIQKNKVAMLREARAKLGATLGRMEARAALIMAMKEAPHDVLTVPMGKVGHEMAVQTAAALGLKDGEYSLDTDSGEALLTLNKAGMDRLVRPVDQAAVGEREIAMAVKRGQEDEEGWLPTGFARRTSLQLDNPIESPASLDRPCATLDPGANPEAIQTALEDYIGLRLAEGHRPSDILAAVSSLTFHQDHFPDQAELGMQLVREKLFPIGKDGAKTLDDLGPHLQQITTGAMARAGIDSAQTMDGQRLQIDHPKFSDAIHRTLAKDPRLQAAYIPTGELSQDQTKMLRDYFRSEIAPRMQGEDAPDAGTKTDTAEAPKAEEPPKKLVFGQDTVEDAADEDGYRRLALPKDPAEAQKIVQTEAERMAGPKPEQFAQSMFGDDEETPEYVEWKQRAETHAEELKKRSRLKGSEEDAAEAKRLQDEVKANLESKGAEVDDSQLKAGNHELHFKSLWAEYVTNMGGLKEAQQAIQDHMAGRLCENLQEHYERATGHALKSAAVPVRHAGDFLKATGTQEERDQDRSDRAREDIKLRKREGGKLAAGSIADTRDERRRAGEAQQAGTERFFNEEPEQEEAGPKHHQRASLGLTVDNQLRQVMPGAVAALHGQKKAFDIKPVSMNGDKIAQQRAVKAATKLGRIGLFYSAGAGKTGIMLGTHSELHHAGKVKKAIYAVPSAVQAQFGAEAAGFLDPQTRLYIHANPGEKFEDRMEAYRHPDTHGVVVTHQALRDDSIRVLASHLGKSPEEATAYVQKAPRAELAEALRSAWKTAGVEPDALFVDEGHNALNRAGKADSTLAKVFDAMADSTPYYIPATADPIKNDPSEAYDWLSKMDAKRYPPDGRAEFMRRYGKNTPITRRALKAELARYYFAERVSPSKTRDDGSKTALNRSIHTAQVTPKQKAALDTIDQAMNRLRTSKTDAEAAKYARIISPSTFEDLEEGQELEAVKSVRMAAGTMREAAYNRILNMDPEGGKVQATVELASQHIEAGKPTIVFAHNHGSLQALQKAMEARGIPTVVLTGKDNAAEKAVKIAGFQPRGGKDPEAHCIIMSDAGATGINLQRGQTVIHHDIPMTHMIHSQRTARAWRLGQQNDVNEITVAADHAFDQTNLRRLKHKEALASIFKSPEGLFDDSGIAQKLRDIRARRISTQTEAA